MKFDTKTVGALVAALVIGFGAGYYLPHSAAAQGARSSYAAGTAARGSFAARGTNQAAGGFLSGTIAKMDSGSITLNTRDGSSHVVLITPDTTVSKNITGSASDLSVGSDVMVTGATNSDGSVSASLIQLRPAGAAGNAPMIPAPQPQ